MQISSNARSSTKSLKTNDQLIPRMVHNATTLHDIHSPKSLHRGMYIIHHNKSPLQVTRPLAVAVSLHGRARTYIYIKTNRALHLQRTKSFFNAASIMQRLSLCRYNVYAAARCSCRYFGWCNKVDWFPYDNQAPVPLSRDPDNTRRTIGIHVSDRQLRFSCVYRCAIFTRLFIAYIRSIYTKTSQLSEQISVYSYVYIRARSV